MAGEALAGWPAFAQLAHTAGLTHDLGKCSAVWQTYLRQHAGPSRGSVEHVPTSLTAIDLLAPTGDPVLKAMIATVVGGHHGHLGRQLPGGNPERARQAVHWFNDNLALGPLDAAEIWSLTLAAKSKSKRSIFDLGKDDLDALRSNVTQEISTRIVHSALIDADWIDTGAWHAKCPPKVTESQPIGQLIDRFEAHKGTYVPTSRWHELQSEVFDQAVISATGKPGFYLLDVPTGIGKTRAALGFAFRQAATGRAQRLVFALPFIALTTQVAAETRRLIFGEHEPTAMELLEHHGLYESTDQRYRYATTNWDATVIVTTTVQLLQSLHSARLRSVRKLHRLAGSIIVLDEWQTIPLDLLTATLQTLTVLVEHFGTTIVLSSATPRQLGRPEMLLPTPTTVINRHLASEAAEHAVRRTRWDIRQIPVTITSLADEVLVSRVGQRCVVMNTRTAAQDLCDAVTMRTAIPVVHLSTSMTPMHREEALARIVQTQLSKDPVIVIATQVIEAGVDVSFPAVWRQQAPLESLIQMAGRCNRRGEWGDHGGTIHVFPLENSKGPDDDYRQRTAITIDLIKQPGATPTDPAVTAAYEAQCQSIVTTTWRKSAGDGNSIREQRIAPGSNRYDIIQSKYQMIDDNTDPVIVTRSHHATAVEQLLREHAQAVAENSPTSTREIRRRLARHAVAVPNAVLKHHPPTEIDGIRIWGGPYDHTYGVNVRALQ